ncbi:MAG: VacB/RNase II family 3'-5' exoribonuclease [Planctomycetota bacterium]
MPARFTQQIIEHMRHPSYRPSEVRQIAREMRVDHDDRPAFDAAVGQLIESGRAEKNKQDELRLPTYGDEVEGSFKLNPRGFGFIRTDIKYREGDLYVPRGRNDTAITGDRVRAVVRRRRNNRTGRMDVLGEIVEVIERGNTVFTGTLIKQKSNWFVEPDGKNLHDPVIIRDPGAKNAKAGDKVVIELLQFPEADYFAEGVITKVLGDAGKPDVETEAVIVAFGLRTEFPEEASEQARGASQQFDEDLKHIDETREDLRDQFIFTIDPPDAKDYDDAISITYHADDGEWELGVHIADVAHFIPQGSSLDEEAKERGNSVYLPRRVIPMLPEVLSNGVCSLQEGVDRLTKSAFIRFNDQGRVVGQRMAATVIRSAKRLTYLEAQALIDGDQKEARRHAKTPPAYTDDLIAALRHADKLARTLLKRRERDGMVTLNLPVVELVFDENGHVVDAGPEDDAFTHRIIEMFMVEANEALARAFEDIGVPILRRIHPEPTFGDIEELRLYARLVEVKLPAEPDRSDLQRLLEISRDTTASRAIHMAVLRTMTKAIYSPSIVGHFALASDHYAHFTSPIRRYPDLTLHRVLTAYLELTDNGKNRPGGRKRGTLTRQLHNDARIIDEGALVQLGGHCSDTEGNAEEAERELRNFLVMQFLEENHLGDELDAVVTGVTNNGVYVSIERFLVEGMVRSTELPGSSDREDRWSLNEDLQRIYAKRSGLSLGMGDAIRVQIVAVDLASRQLDLRVTEMPEKPNIPSRRRGQGHGDLPRASRSSKSHSKGKGKGGKGKGKSKGGKRRR